MRAQLERYFEFAKLQTTWRTEILAGLTTFMTMAYIIIYFLHIRTRGVNAVYDLAKYWFRTCPSPASGSCTTPPDRQGSRFLIDEDPRQD